tara:strand:- start:53234 stop:54598 length:1365 start_codon:yes stop_codon:yes gene_type:complete
MSKFSKLLNNLKIVFNNKHYLVIFLLGFASGLPLLLTMGTLQAWYAQANVDIVTIGFLGLVSLPYTFKFLWAPILDRFKAPLCGKALGLRRGWIFLSQIFLVIFLIAMAFSDPILSPGLLALFAVCVAFMSATQDIAFDAYRTETLAIKERGLGSVIYVYGYRVALIISGSVALIISYHFGWMISYLFMASVMSMCLFITYYADEPESHIKYSNSDKLNRKNKKQSDFNSVVIEPFRDFIKRDKSILLLLLLVSYKLGEAFSVSLQTPFFIQALGFTTEEIGYISKTCTTIATLVGISIGGGIINSLGLYRALFLFGVLQAVTNLLYIWMLYVGHNLWVMGITVFFDQFAGGLGTAAFMVLIMILCNQKYTATQFALLSALASVGRVYVSPISGYIVTLYGWYNLFVFSFIISLPCLFLLFLTKKNILLANQDQEDISKEEQSLNINESIAIED